MKNIPKSPGEIIGDLAGAIGGTRKLADSLGVSVRTIQRYISSDSIPKRIQKKVRQRQYYYNVVKPKREIQKMPRTISDKLRDYADQNLTVKINSLMPEGFDVFAFNLANSLEDDLRMQFVQEALDLGLVVYGDLTIEQVGGADIFRVRNVEDLSEIYKIFRSKVQEVGSETAARLKFKGTGEGI